MSQDVLSAHVSISLRPTGRLGLTIASCSQHINTFAVELLCSIFELSRERPVPHLGMFDIHRQNLSLARLAAVCRRWRSVAVECASLWCNIAFSTSRPSTIHCATKFLHQLKETSLFVQIWDLMDENEYTEELDSLLQKLVYAGPRITRCEIFEPSEYLIEVLQCPVDKMTHLTVHGREDARLPLFFGGPLSNLKYLTYSNVGRWPLQDFPNLTELVLDNGSQVWQLGSLLDCIDGCEKLSLLSLSHFHTPHTAPVGHKTATLPGLQRLNLSFCDSNILLHHLDIPPTTFVSVSTDSSHGSQNIFQCLPPPLHPLPFLQNTESLTVVFDVTNNDFHITTFCQSAPACLLQMYDPQRRIDGRWVFWSLNIAMGYQSFFGITSLTLVMDQVLVPWKMWLSRLHRLSRIDVCYPDTRDLILTLSMVENGGVVVCPSLEEISIETCGAKGAVEMYLLRTCQQVRADSGCKVPHFVVDGIEVEL